MRKEESFGIFPLQQEGEGWKIFLILHRGSDHWSFPKGRSNPGENAKDAATRELREETGLQVKEFLLDEPLVESYCFYVKRDKVRKTVHYFAALVTGDVSLQPEEISAGKWVLLSEAAAALTFKETQELCRKLIQKLAYV